MYILQDPVFFGSGDWTESIVDNMFYDLYQKYQRKMVADIKDSDFIFDYIVKIYK